jgi:hypothetical protein
MPKGPKGQRRPADVIGTAIMVARIATGEIEEAAPKVSAAAELGAKGGRARAMRLTPEQKSEAASLAGQARWRKK